MNDATTGIEPNRMTNALAGGWVADAASLGLHWLYDSRRILEVGGSTPEFLPPKAEYFEGGAFGYFAHEGKHIGDPSHYGAATGVLIDSLLCTGGKLDTRDYQRHFRTFFGPGGQWRGYIDNPTRITLDNLNRIEQVAIDKALVASASALSPEQQRILVQKVLPYTRRLSGEALVEPVRQAISLTYKEAAIQEAGVRLAQAIDRRLESRSGADDRQLPAVSKLPPLVACLGGHDDLMAQVDAAVRVTNDNNDAVAWARCAAVLLEGVFKGQPLAGVLAAAASQAPDPQVLLEASGGSSLDALEAADRYGRTCYLHEAMPVIFHILSQAESYTDAIRANIQCGGDSCGRAWIIGPVMAALHGVGGDRGMPLSWLARVTDAANRYRQIERLVSMAGWGAS